MLNIPQEQFAEKVLIKATVAVSRPQEVNTDEVAGFSRWEQPRSGPLRGLTVDGLCIPGFGDSDVSIEAAIAAVEVYIKE